VAETLIVGPNGIMSLAPTPTVLRLEKLCTERRMEEAIALVDEERRKGRRGEIDADKASRRRFRSGSRGWDSPLTESRRLIKQHFGCCT
jgi:hypothetical protein